MAPYARHVLQTPGGAYHKVATAQPGGAYSNVARDPESSCVPCGCGPSVCGADCTPHCEGPGCVKVATPQGIQCFDIVFAGYRLRDRCLSPSGQFETLREVFAFPERVRVFRNVQSQNQTQFQGTFPILTRERVFDVSSGQQVGPTSIQTEQELLCILWHCQSPGDDGDLCPMIRSLTMGALAGFTNGSFTRQQDDTFFFFGVEIPNLPTDPFGCSSSTRIRLPFLLNNAVAVPAADCSGPHTNYYWERCGDGERVTVDLTTRPEGEYLNVRHNGDVYTPTGEQSFEDADAVTWTLDDCPTGGGGGGEPGGSDAGGAEPSDGVAFTDPAVRDYVERQKNASMGRNPQGCDGCGP